jgi:hypothetical protein
MIRVPRKHIADDVAARIMAVEKRINANSVAAQGQNLDNALQQPVGDVAPIEGIEDALTARALDL